MGKQDKRVRNVAKDLYDCVYNDFINPRLNKMEEYVKQQLDQMNARSQRIQGFLLGEVKHTIANELDDAKITRLALLEILNEKLGVEGLAALVEARKPEVQARLVKEAEERMLREQEEARKKMEEQLAAQKAQQENKGPGADSVPSETPAAPAEGASNG